MERSRPVHLKAYIRAVVAITLIIVWGLAAFSGFLLWSAPAGPRRGWHVLFLGLTKREWGELHFWVSCAAMAVTLIHVIIDRRALRSCIRYLTSAQRGPVLGA
jgi:Domain of unknown function (DUF4405)